MQQQQSRKYWPFPLSISCFLLFLAINSAKAVPPTDIDYTNSVETTASLVQKNMQQAVSANNLSLFAA